MTRLSGRQHLIADYLLDEVLSRQSKEVQRFLLDSSILDELCAPLCDALSGNGDGKPNAQAILETLERANLFLIPLDDDAAHAHTWFRYHHLFADALRNPSRKDTGLAQPAACTSAPASGMKGMVKQKRPSSMLWLLKTMIAPPA